MEKSLDFMEEAKECEDSDAYLKAWNCREGRLGNLILGL